MDDSAADPKSGAGLRSLSGLVGVGLAGLALCVGFGAFYLIALGYDPCGLGDNECTANTGTIVGGWIFGGMAAAAAVSALVGAMLALRYSVGGRGLPALYKAVIVTFVLLFLLMVGTQLSPVQATDCGNPGCDPR